MTDIIKYNRRFDSRESRDGYLNNNNSRESKYDEPPHSRLFIVCGKSITEDDFRESFSKYGTIEEIWVVKDRHSDEPKGVTYIKFSKTSEAALAMEEMNGRCIGSHPRPLKVLIAHSRDQGSRRDTNEEERLLRLFVVVPKSMSESEMREHFAQFGDIDYVSIVRDRATRDSKGFGYVKYHRMSHTSKAFEECDRTFKPVFADPKPQKNDMKMDPLRGGDPRGGDMRAIEGYGGGFPTGPYMGPHHNPNNNVHMHGGGFNALAHMDTGGLNPDGLTRLMVIASPTLNQDMMWKLFDLIPGLDYCDLRKDRGQGRCMVSVQYNNAQSATYAKEKLHGFEYPPGQRLIIKYDTHEMPNRHPNQMMGGNPNGPPFGGMGRGGMPNMPPNGTIAGNGVVSQSGPLVTNNSLSGSRPSSGNLQQDLAAQLAETIAQATSIIQAAGLSQGGAVNNINGQSPSGGMTGETYDPSYCSVKLPVPQPLAPVESVVAERLFIVCHPVPPPIYALKDVFGRFGNLIDIYMLSGKTFGYAKFASKESAVKAIMVLHGQEVLGSRLKVFEADPHDKADSGRKRFKMDE